MPTVTRLHHCATSDGMQSMMWCLLSLLCGLRWLKLSLLGERLAVLWKRGPSCFWEPGSGKCCPRLSPGPVSPGHSTKQVPSNQAGPGEAVALSGVHPSQWRMTCTALSAQTGITPSLSNHHEVAPKEQVTLGGLRLRSLSLELLGKHQNPWSGEAPCLLHSTSRGGTPRREGMGPHPSLSRKGHEILEQR